MNEEEEQEILKILYGFAKQFVEDLVKDPEGYKNLEKISMSTAIHRISQLLQKQRESTLKEVKAVGDQVEKEHWLNTNQQSWYLAEVANKIGVFINEELAKYSK